MSTIADEELEMQEMEVGISLHFSFKCTNKGAISAFPIEKIAEKEGKTNQELKGRSLSITSDLDDDDDDDSDDSSYSDTSVSQQTLTRSSPNYTSKLLQRQPKGEVWAERNACVPSSSS